MVAGGSLAGGWGSPCPELFGLQQEAGPRSRNCARLQPRTPSPQLPTAGTQQRAEQHIPDGVYSVDAGVSPSHQDKDSRKILGRKNASARGDAAQNPGAEGAGGAAAVPSYPLLPHKGRVPRPAELLEASSTAPALQGHGLAPQSTGQPGSHPQGARPTRAARGTQPRSAPLLEG